MASEWTAISEAPSTPSRPNWSSKFTPAVPRPKALIVNCGLGGEYATVSGLTCAGSFMENMALASEYLSQGRADAISQGALGGALALMVLQIDLLWLKPQLAGERKGLAFDAFVHHG